MMKRQQHYSANIKSRIEQLRAELHAIYSLAKAENREFTPKEVERADKLSDGIARELDNGVDL